MAREDLHAARLKHRWVVPPLQQVVQHLVLGEPTIVQKTLRHVDRVRQAPPSIALALVGGTGVARARHRVPLHPIEVAQEPGAAFDLRPPGPVHHGRRERHRAGGGKRIEAGEEQYDGEPSEAAQHGSPQKYTVAANESPWMEPAYDHCFAITPPDDLAVERW